MCVGQCARLRVCVLCGNYILHFGLRVVFIFFSVALHMITYPPPFTREAVFRKKPDEEFESLQTNLYIQKEKAQRKNPCAFSGAEGETRTLAPVTRPTPLAGAPRHQLEYFCIGSVYDTIRLLKERAEKPLSLLSGGESGIRTHGTLPYDGFQDRSVITTSVSLRIRRKL